MIKKEMVRIWTEWLTGDESDEMEAKEEKNKGTSNTGQGF
jgi:hypothetical protein